MNRENSHENLVNFQCNFPIVGLEIYYSTNEKTKKMENVC